MGVEVPDCPDVLSHVWGWFCDLSSARRSGFGPEPIGYPEIEAYARLMRIEPDPFEVEAIRAIDRAVLATEANRQKPGQRGLQAPDGKTVRAAADMRDADSVKGLMRGFGAKTVRRQSKRSTAPSS